MRRWLKERVLKSARFPGGVVTLYISEPKIQRLWNDVEASLGVGDIKSIVVCQLVCVLCTVATLSKWICWIHT